MVRLLLCYQSSPARPALANARASSLMTSPSCLIVGAAECGAHADDVREHSGVGPVLARSRVQRSTAYAVNRVLSEVVDGQSDPVDAVGAVASLPAV